MGNKKRVIYKIYICVCGYNGRFEYVVGRQRNNRTGFNGFILQQQQKNACIYYTYIVQCTHHTYRHIHKDREYSTVSGSIGYICFFVRSLGNTMDSTDYFILCSGFFLALSLSPSRLYPLDGKIAAILWW